ncbi:hypothetical protein niasHT_002978 [Heterodera trifolii]|uniref:Effector protein n=1 Tax=Heterodera trifolii TaxID=157864 RepID=A0ABD2LPH2_9BILA
MLIIIAIILCALKEFPSTSAIPTDLFDELWPTNFGSPPPGEAAQENAIEKHQNAKQQKSHGQKRRIKTEPAEDYDPNYGANRQQLNGKWPKLAAVKAEVSTLINDDVGHLGAPIKVEQGENCTVKVEKGEFSMRNIQ